MCDGVYNLSGIFSEIGNLSGFNRLVQKMERNVIKEHDLP